MSYPLEPDVDDDLDMLTRAELAELPGPARAVADVLDEWTIRRHGIASSHHGAGLFLDLLAAEGWRVEPIDPGPPLDELLPPSVD